MIRLVATLLGLLVATSITSVPSQALTANPQASAIETAWGIAQPIGRAAQTDGPALAFQDERTIIAWIDATEDGLYHTLAVSNRAASQVVRLTILTIRPQRISLFSDGGDGYFMLWLDADPDNLSDGLRLWAAKLDDLLQVERGALILSDGPTYDYTATVDSDGDLQIVWSGSPAAEPSLYWQRMDSAGRPLETARLQFNVEQPTLVNLADGSVRLVWVDRLQNRVVSGTLADGTVIDIRALAEQPDLSPGDVVDEVAVGVDSSHLTLFWNITRATGDAETWFASQPLSDSSEVAVPGRLGMRLVPGNRVVGTGYRDVFAPEAEIGTRWASWATVATRTSSETPTTITVATQVEDTVGLLFLNRGVVVAYLPIARLNTIGLIGPPRAAVDDDGSMALAWAQPQPDALAALYAVSSR